jgi:general nucleoside transport system ATP-binding protein
LQRNGVSVVKNSVQLIERFDVRTPGPLVPASNLSGGNQQKVIVSREFSRPIRLLLVNQPTRGLDVGSIEYIHRQIVEMRDEGIAVLLISAELDEIMSLADRIAVMFHGQLVATIPSGQVSREELGLLMAGSSLDAVKTSLNFPQEYTGCVDGAAIHTPRRIFTLESRADK